MFVGGCLVANLVLVSVTRTRCSSSTWRRPRTATGLFPTLPDKVFLVTQCSIAFFVTGGLVTGRAFMAKLAPQKMLNEFFGLFAMSGTAMSFVGPLVIGQVTASSAISVRALRSASVFLLIGLIGLFKVREQAAGQ